MDQEFTNALIRLRKAATPSAIFGAAAYYMLLGLAVDVSYRVAKDAIKKVV